MNVHRCVCASAVCQINHEETLHPSDCCQMWLASHKTYVSNVTWSTSLFGSGSPSWIFRGSLGFGAVRLFDWPPHELWYKPQGLVTSIRTVMIFLSGLGCVYRLPAVRVLQPQKGLWVASQFVTDRFWVGLTSGIQYKLRLRVAQLMFVIFHTKMITWFFHDVIAACRWFSVT